MPELTEVEIVRRSLAKLHGGAIVRIESNDARVFVPRIDVTGRVIRDVGRRGKWLRIELTGGVVFSHLGMTGDWTLHAPDDPALRFERVRMDVERKGKITSARYTDARRFGRFVTDVRDIEAWRDLGPDPLADGFDEARFLAATKKRKRTIKEVLLDQSLLSGVGNILAVETLWNARIDPRTPSNHLRARDVSAIARGLRLIIERTLAYDEESIETHGRAKAPFRVYGRDGEACPRCAGTIRQIVLGGRGTAFCSGCQKRPAK